VTIAENGRSPFRNVLLQPQEIDLIFMDLEMPVLDATPPRGKSGNFPDSTKPDNRANADAMTAFKNSPLPPDERLNH
jgi:hypothetical protein